MPTLTSTLTQALLKRLFSKKQFETLKKVKDDLLTEFRCAELRTYSEKIIRTLAHEIGIRNVHTAANYEALDKAYLWLRDELEEFGYEKFFDQTFVSRCHEVTNLVVEVPGRGEHHSEIIVFGAHYDSAPNCPGANDNSSGVAATLCLAGYFRKHPQDRTLRFAFFVNEEPPMFDSEDMGSTQYAQYCKEQSDNIVAMVTPDTIGYYSEEPDSQYVPDFMDDFGLKFPTVGNFLAVVGTEPMRELTEYFAEEINGSDLIEGRSLVLPPSLPGVTWSDHASFWKAGFPAIMLTDTALYRYKSYHDEDDTADHLTYASMARAIEAIRVALIELANIIDFPRTDKPEVAESY